ncbi:MAG: putative lipid II flippase FtsW [Burkholderiaceae bacterium]
MLSLNPFKLLRQEQADSQQSRRKQQIRADIAARIDEPLLWVTAALVLLGVVMVFSASIALPESPKYSNYSSTHFLTRHVISLIVALALALITYAVPVAQWQRLAPWLFLLGLLLLVLVLVPGIGKTVLGAQRWIPLPFFSLQPSELMKVFVVLYVADYTVRKQDHMQRVRKGILPMGAAVMLVGVLLMLEPDLGAFIVICAIAAGMLFLGGINAKLFVGLIVAALSSFVMVISLSEFRRQRIFAYMDPFHPDHVSGKGYQLSQSLIAFGRGEFSGVGLGGSVEKMHYLPEPHTDFLLAVIGEELGLVGVLIVILLMFWLVRRIFEIGRQAIALDQTFAGLMAYGIALWLGVQSFINMGVNLGVLPTKGLTLPLMSFGGTALLCNLVVIGMALRVDSDNRRLMRGGR